MLPPFPGLTHNGMAVLGIVLWASVMWVSEAMPTGITGISIPTLLLITQAIPWQGGKPPMSIIFAGFTNHVIWLCLFAFLVGAVMQLVGLDKRIALGILARLKASSVGRVIWGMFFVNIVLGFLVPRPTPAPPPCCPWCRASAACSVIRRKNGPPKRPSSSSPWSTAP